MSIVDRSSIARLEEIRERARSASSWEASYQWAARGLEAAIAQLKQVDMVTSGFSINLEKE